MKPYKEKCKYCNKEYIIYAQEDDNPEYYIQVYIKCDCKEYVEFSLPVN